MNIEGIKQVLFQKLPKCLKHRKSIDVIHHIYKLYE